jgi:hypothetical protein
MPAQATISGLPGLTGRKKRELDRHLSGWWPVRQARRPARRLATASTSVSTSWWPTSTASIVQHEQVPASARLRRRRCRAPGGTRGDRLSTRRRGRELRGKLCPPRSARPGRLSSRSVTTTSSYMDCPAVPIDSPAVPAPLPTQQGRPKADPRKAPLAPHRQRTPFKILQNRCPLDAATLAR